MVERIIAFVPVRGGSKSIPLKNIKLFCGKPLIYWTIDSLSRLENLSKIIIATDSQEIIDTVSKFQFDKIEIYKRLPENATDTASTESVMLEYISCSDVSESDIFMLVQATSPLTESIHFEEALIKYMRGTYDSMISVVKSLRFFWDIDGNAINYDIYKRPRRQDFDGIFMENGAFYINRVSNIVKFKNRINGNIGLYVMPEYTGFEIDEPDDWAIMESLMKKKNSKLNIKLFISDVDGVLTDGGMYYSAEGDVFKKFNTKDGMAFQLLRQAGLKTGIITSEETKIVEQRALKIKCDYLYQGKMHGGKLEATLDICEKEQITLDQVAYIGDDINCIELLSRVGLAACPSDAVTKVKNIPNIIILDTKGGDGVVREFVDKYILN